MDAKKRIARDDARVVIIIVCAMATFYSAMFSLVGAMNISRSTPLFFISVALFANFFFSDKSKYLKIFLGCVMLFCTWLAFHGKVEEAYYGRFDAVGDSSVDLSEYSPFKEGTKVAELDKPSTLKFIKDDDLPVLDGATALYPLYSAFAQAVYPKGDYFLWPPQDEELRHRYISPSSEVSCTTTLYAYDNLIEDGTADIIFVASPSKAQLEKAKKEDVELVFTPIGKEAFVFFVNSKNKVNSLSTEQIKKIYSKEIKNWAQVGGYPLFIRAYQRTENSGSQTAMINFMGETRLSNPPAQDRIRPMEGIISETASYRNHGTAIGYSFLFFVTEMVNNNNVKLIAVDGVKPTRENIKNGTYPYASEFFAVTRKDNENPNVDKFIKWILSPQGQELVEKTGYTPIKQRYRR